MFQRRRVDRPVDLLEIDDDAGSDERVQRYLIDAGSALDEVHRGVNVRAGVRADP